MSHLGPVELLIILTIVMIIFGVGRLPEIGAALGKAIRELRQATSEEVVKEKKSE
ncbi:TPA: twin-arginine translocase TatA/TatE family subunit [Candidatus Bipolaricaulota bacterium]|nr:twin-arginine translocase TatA/TatE family subunit [Candidatus Bipolaricaulota bacterium]